MNIRTAVLIALVGLWGCTAKDTAMERSHTIIFFGDSITEQGDKPKGYVSVIRDTVVSRGVHCRIIGAGISGNKVTDLKRRLQKDVAEKKPSVVVIYIGINDVWHFQFADRGLTGTPKDQYRLLLTEIIAELQENGATVLLATPSVVGEKSDGTNKWDFLLDEYAELSRVVARERGALLLDLRKEFIRYLKENNPSNSEKDILTNDGVHLNDAGNLFVARHMLKLFDEAGLLFPKK